MINGLSQEEIDIIQEEVRAAVEAGMQEQIKTRDRGIRKLSRTNNHLKKQVQELQKQLEAAKIRDEEYHRTWTDYRMALQELEEAKDKLTQAKYNMGELWQQKMELMGKVETLTVNLERARGIMNRMLEERKREEATRTEGEKA